MPPADEAVARGPEAIAVVRTPDANVDGSAATRGEARGADLDAEAARAGSAPCVPVVAGADGVPVASPGAAQGAGAVRALAGDLSSYLLDRSADSVFSPVSVAVALAVLSEGAKGGTLAEILRVLHLRDSADVRRSIGALATGLRRCTSSDEVHVATSVWLEGAAPIATAVQTTLEASYDAELHDADFARRPDEARAAINVWARRRTAGRISEAVAPGAVSRTTRIVLANAVFMKAAWNDAFDPGATEDATFHAAGGAVTVRMMRQVHRFAYARIAGAQAVELPYVGDLSMVVVLPDPGTDLATIEPRALRTSPEWLASTAMRRIDLELPAWKTERVIDGDLNRALQALGMVTAFDARKADLSVFGPGLSLSETVQDAMIRVDERGTEAAAVTVAVMRPAALERPEREEPPVVFHVDRPFLYFVRDRPTGAILFVGHGVKLGP